MVKLEELGNIIVTDVLVARYLNPADGTALIDQSVLPTEPLGSGKPFD